MKKSILIVSFLFATSFFISCQKDKEIQPSSADNAKEMVVSNNNQTKSVADLETESEPEASQFCDNSVSYQYCNIYKIPASKLKFSFNVTMLNWGNRLPRSSHHIVKYRIGYRWYQGGGVSYMPWSGEKWLLQPNINYEFVEYVNISGNPYQVVADMYRYDPRCNKMRWIDTFVYTRWY